MSTLYDTDVLAWANEQAALLRAGKLDEIDVENIAEEIEDVGRSEVRDLENRLASLISILFRWQYQPELRGTCWQQLIALRRSSVHSHLKETPSLKACLQEPDCLAIVWSDAIVMAIEETDMDCFPENPVWSVEMILSDSFYPD